MTRAEWSISGVPQTYVIALLAVLNSQQKMRDDIEASANTGLIVSHYGVEL